MAHAAELGSASIESVTQLHEPQLHVTYNDISRPNQSITIDIEHAIVRDDPRTWSRTRKNIILAIIASVSVIATLGANIYNPAIKNIQSELHATDQEIALSLSLFIIVQGNAPLLWSAISEIKGRKTVYLSSITLFVVGCIVVATAKSIGLVIGMRCVQAAGASAVLSIGAATLADIYEPHERGTMMGIFYAAPLLGPSLGPIIGGVLTQLFSWRATFWFLAIFGVLSLLSFVLFKDTFRRERSLAYQAVLKRERDHSAKGERAVCDQKELPDVGTQEKGLTSKKAETATIPPDVPKHVMDVSLTLKDVNPFRPLAVILRRWNNIVILIASGFMFAFSYSITYTCSRTFSISYHYNALQIGFVLLAFGLGCMAGSILGGRWSDRILMRLKTKNGGQGHPEMRLESTRYAMIFLPLSCIAYAWLCQERVHVAAVCVALFLEGFFSIWIYSSTLAYIVDANTGRSSTAVATNSSFRGIAGFIAAEVAAPLQDAIGDGGLYTLWAGLLVIAELLVLLVIWKGGKWRERGQAREAQSQSQ